MSGSANQNEFEFEPLLDELRHVRRVTQERAADPTSKPETGYEILRELRRGGQGIVYEAIQRSTGRRVALKVLLHGGVRSEREKQRFCREVDLLASLRHRSIVTLFDSGELNGEPFYAMEFIDGDTLNAAPELRFPGKQTEHSRLKAHIRKVLSTFVVVCDAVACFQRNGLIHRDLKPDNILMDRDGVPHIVDFGLARISAVDAESQLPFDYRHGFTLTGEFLGMPAYASPEQATGDSRDVDIRSDVYSLGVILFELLTGHLPVPMTGSIVEILQRIAEQDPVRPSAINSSVDSDVDAIVLKCLSKDPERRYQSAAELAADLRRWLDGQPVTARSDSAWYVIRKSLRKHKLAVGTAIGFITLISAAGVVSFVLWRQAVRDRNEARAEVYVASLYAANAAQNEHRTLDALDLLMRPAKELRGWEWQYVLSRIDHAVSTSKLFAENVQSCAWSPDRQLLALIDTTGRLRLHRTADGSPASGDDALSELRPTVVAFRPAHSELLIAEQTGRIRLFDMNQAKWTDITGLPSGNPMAISFDRTGQCVAVALQRDQLEHVVCVWSFDKQSLVQTLSFGRDVNSVALAGTANLVAVGGTTLEVHDVVSGQLVSRIATPDSLSVTARANQPARVSGSTAVNGLLTCLRFSPDDSLIAAGSTDGTVILADPKTGALRHRLMPHRGPVSCVEFSDDGTQLLSGSNDSVTRVWDVASGQLLTAKHGHLHWILGVSFSGADEASSVSGRGELKRFRIGSDTNDRRLNLHGSVVTAARFIQSGETLLTGSLDGRSRAVRTDSGKSIKRLISGSVAVTAIDVDENRSMIAAGSADGVVRIFTTETGDQRKFVPGPTFQESSPVRAVAVSADDALLAIGLESGEIRLRHTDGRNHESIVKLHDRPVRFVGFVNAGALLISEDEKNLKVTDVRTHRVRHHLSRPLSAYYAPVAIHPATTLVVAGDSMGRINAWDADTGHPQAPFQWHATSVTALCFSTDGSRLISAATDGSIKVWDVARRAEVFALPNVQGFVTQLDFSPDQKRIAAGLFDGTVVLFEAIPASKRVTNQESAP